MLQQYITKHTHPSIAPLTILATPAPSATQNMVAWNTSLGKSVSLEDANYFINSQQTLAGGTTGYYIAQRVNRIQGYADMVSLITGSFDVSGFTGFCQAMPFFTSQDLSAGPQITLAGVTWLPVQYQAIPQEVVTAVTAVHLCGEFAVPVPNNPSVALWAGLAIWGGFPAGARQINGAFSLRHVRTENSVFIPNK